VAESTTTSKFPETGEAKIRSRIESEINYLEGSIAIGDLDPEVKAHDVGKLEGIRLVEQMLWPDKPREGGLNLIYLPNEFLFKKAKEFDFKSPVENVNWIESEMFRILEEHNGLGLSANQVCLDARLFVMKRKNGSKLFCINPTILQASRIMASAIEGCLSNPGATYPISRPKKCRIQYFDKNGKKHTLQLTGIDARCAQHEIDHLDGINIHTKVLNSGI